MKKSIISMFMVFALIASLAACKKMPDDVYVETSTNENGEVETTIPADLEEFLSSFDTSDPAVIEQQFEQMLNSETVDVKLEFGDELIDDSNSTKIKIELNEKGEPDRSGIENNYKDIMSGDSFTMDIVIRQSSNGEDVNIPLYVTCDGDKYYCEMTAPYESKGTITFSALSNGDGKIYIILPSMRAYMQISSEEMGDVPLGDLLSDQMADIENNENDTSVYVETREVEISGKKYSCDIYEDDDITVKYYFSEDSLKRIETIDGDGNITIMEINSISAEADSSKFKAPTHYFDMTSILTSGAALSGAVS